MDLPHLLDIIDKWDNSSHNWYGSRQSKDTVCNAEGRKLIDFCEKMVLTFQMENMDLTQEGNSFSLISWVAVS
jgi:hypothetical protein